MPYLEGPAGHPIARAAHIAIYALSAYQNETYGNSVGEVHMAPKFQMRLRGQEDVLEHIDIMREWFKRSDTLAELKNQTNLTLQWLKQNKFSYEPPDFPMQQTPWWKPLEPTGDPVITEIRTVGLRYRIYEHGLIDFLKGLEVRGVLGEVPCKALTFAVDGNIRAALEQLVLLSKKGAPESNLRVIATLFGLSENVKSAKFRDGMLVRLTSMGLLIARYDGENYGVRIGPVATEFYENVYVPMVGEMKSEIKGLDQ